MAMRIANSKSIFSVFTYPPILPGADSRGTQPVLQSNWLRSHSCTAIARRTAASQADVRQYSLVLRFGGLLAGTMHSRDKNPSCQESSASPRSVRGEAVNGELLHRCCKHAPVYPDVGPCQGTEVNLHGTRRNNV